MMVPKLHTTTRKLLLHIHTTDRHTYRLCNCLLSHPSRISPQDLPIKYLTASSPATPNTTMLLHPPSLVAQVSRQRRI